MTVYKAGNTVPGQKVPEQFRFMSIAFGTNTIQLDGSAGLEKRNRNANTMIDHARDERAANQRHSVSKWPMATDPRSHELWSDHQAVPS